MFSGIYVVARRLHNPMMLIRRGARMRESHPTSARRIAGPAGPLHALVGQRSWILNSRVVRPLRSDPRFQAILDGMGLAESR